MIGKIKKGSGFKGCVNYVLGKEQAVLLHADGVLTESRGDIIRSFCMQTGMNPDLKKPVGHIALSYSAVDAPKLTDEKMVQLAQEYMREMKITDTQYIIVRHQDREHPHVHIVFNRIDNNGKTISDRNDMYRNEQVCKKLKTKHGLYFAGGKEQVKQHRLKEPDKSKYEIYTAVKNEIGKFKNWRQLQERLAEKGITVRFKYKGQTGEIQGVSFSKGEYTFKGSEIDRNFSFSKLDKCFGDAGLNTVGNQRQTAFTPVREPLPTQGKTDSPLITGSLGLFTASSPPADEGKYSINSLVYWVTYVHNVVYSFYRSMIYCYINSTQRCAGSIVIDIIPTNGADKRKFFPFAPYFPVTNVIKRYFYPYFPAIIGIKGYSFPYFPYLSGIMKIKTALYSLFSRLDWHKTVVFPCLGEIYEGIRSLSWEIPVT